MIDYYKILDIKYSSPIEDIKKSYKKLVLETHPDTHPNDLKKEAQFKLINEAYEILSDTDKKKEYDKKLKLERSKDSYKTKVKCLDIYITCKVDMKGCYNGCIKNISYNRNFRVENGKIQYDTCNINLKIEPCFNDGDIIKIDNMGETSDNPNVKNGDLYVRVYLDDKDYQRQELDVFTTKHISCIDACLGVDVDIELLDGSSLTLHVPEGTQYGDSFRIKEKGLYIDKIHGDMYIKVIVDIPKNLSNKSKRLLKKLKSLL